MAHAFAKPAARPDSPQVAISRSLRLARRLKHVFPVGLPRGSARPITRTADAMRSPPSSAISFAFPPRIRPDAAIARASISSPRRMTALGLSPDGHRDSHAGRRRRAAIRRHGVVRVTGPRTLYFHGHYDVVPADGEGQFDPDMAGRHAIRPRIGGHEEAASRPCCTRSARSPTAASRLDGRVALMFVPDEETGGRPRLAVPDRCTDTSGEDAHRHAHRRTDERGRLERQSRRHLAARHGQGPAGSRRAPASGCERIRAHDGRRGSAARAEDRSRDAPNRLRAASRTPRGRQS